MVKRRFSLKDEIWETLMIIKICLTTFWFWLPVLYMAYIFVQLWMIFFVHPLTIVILPIVLSIHLVRRVEKRLRLQYGINNVRYVRASRPLGEPPKKEPSKWKVEGLLEESFGCRGEEEES